ncbi:MAG: hypothetical protein JWM86_1201 [Thermoleophilia bacterium]|nr:hypothetical protein [Thermoleophilia bacterium]
MCNGISSATTSAMPASSTTAGGSTAASSLVAGASGGGATAAPATDLATALAQAQQAIAALTAAIPGLTGGGALGAPAAAAQPAAPDATTGGGAPGQTPGQTPAQTPTQHDHAAGGGTTAAGHAHGKGHAGMKMVERTKPEDRAKAQKYLAANAEFFKDFKRSDLTFKAGKNTHGKLSDAQRAAFEKKYPGLEAPTAVVFPKKGGNAPIGVVYNKGTEKNFDLGMGSMHVHAGGKNAMQHVWFTTNDLDFAFSDQEGGGAKKAQQLIAGGGAPAKK